MYALHKQFLLFVHSLDSVVEQVLMAPVRNRDTDLGVEEGRRATKIW